MLHVLMSTIPGKFETGTDMSAATGQVTTGPRVAGAEAAEQAGEREAPTAVGMADSPGVAAPSQERLDVSPSLLRRVRGGPVAYEWKFVVDEPTALRIEELLRESLTIDPHADDRRGGAYLVTTVYFDTPQWEVLRGIGRHKLQKFRLRRYGEAADFFVERKAKRGKQVRKRRDAWQAGDVEACLPAPRADGANGNWFARQLVRQGLRPICRVQYSRRAYFGAAAEGRVRLTFDRQLRGAPVDGWNLSTTRDDVPILVDRVICEFKFAGTMPTLFKRVIQELQLEATGFSKYRHGMRAFGLGPALPTTTRDAKAPETSVAPTAGDADA